MADYAAPQQRGLSLEVQSHACDWLSAGSEKEDTSPSLPEPVSMLDPFVLFPDNRWCRSGIAVMTKKANNKIRFPPLHAHYIESDDESVAIHSQLPSPSSPIWYNPPSQAVLSRMQRAFHV